jgi:hypothetical protein
MSKKTLLFTVKQCEGGGTKNRQYNTKKNAFTGCYGSFAPKKHPEKRK